MTKRKVIQVFEHKSIAYKGAHKNSLFTFEEFKALESYFQKNEKTQFFDLIPYGVRFKEFVGAIQVGKCTIEVLPKAGKDENKKGWQKVLLDMLKTCQLLAAKESGEANLKLKSNSVLELYFELFISEIESLLHHGLIKKYRKSEGQQKALKGSLIFSEHLSKNIIHKERFYTRHTIYDRNHLLHQILNEALTIVEELSISPLLRDRIGRVKMDFPPVPPLKITSQHFDRIRIDRKSYPYRKALEISKLLILNFRPDISSGRQNLLAIMFNMNTLWEEYVYRILKGNMPPTWKVESQQSDKFWENKSIRPDIVLTSQTNKKFVIDTKWKVIENEKPDDSDLKQMFVYNHHWSSDLSILLYPKSNGQKDHKGTYKLHRNDCPHYCLLGFVDVIEEKGLRSDIAQQILEKLQQVKSQLIP